MQKITNKSPFTVVETITERYIYNRGKLIFKQWLDHTQPSLILNHNGWPNEWVS